MTEYAAMYVAVKTAAAAATATSKQLVPPLKQL